MSEVTITAANFETEVLKAEIPVVLDFWATWCGPCRLLAPILEQVAEEYAGKIKVGKVNVDEEGELAQKFRVMSIPTLHLYKNGALIDESIGLMPAEELKAFIDKAF